MTKTSKIILVTIIATSILLGLGYAAIQNITLNITGTAVANPNQSNFKVHFVQDKAPTVSNSAFATATVTDDINATINVSGLTSKGQVVSAVYTVKNSSTDLSSDLSVATTNSNTEYFTLSSELANTSLKAGETTTVTVTVELTKTPLDGNVSSTIGVQLTAAPVQPGEEGSSGITNDYSQTPALPTLALVTNDNIGDYIDLGNDIIDNSLLGTTGVTSDDWRILYKDEENVYVILADYLPAEQVPASAGLDTNVADYPYSVWSDTDRDRLINGLKNTTAWSNFTNGIVGATATGSPTAELLMSSYNTKNGTELVYTDYPTLDSSTEDYDLYVTHTEAVIECSIYWLASPITGDSSNVLSVSCDGSVDYFGSCSLAGFGVRPVVTLPLTTVVESVDGVWVVK